MPTDHAERIAWLQQHVVPVDPHDTLAEAGRKVLLADFIKMLSHEAGSRAGADIEDVHDMRVATRRMRSAFRLLKVYYKPSVVESFRRRLGKIAQALGDIRDLDVMIDDLKRHQMTLDPDQQAALQDAIDALDQRRAKARRAFVKLVAGRQYAKFIDVFGAFLTTPEMGAKANKSSGVVAYQVRHVVPVILHSHLAAVRAYDTALDGADFATLHGLRIEFKRLRYAVSFFTDVLGASVNDFIGELKTIQDHLGRLNDMNTALAILGDIPNAVQNGVVRDYRDWLEAERVRLQTGFGEVWARFNSRSVQRMLSDALLVLR